MTTIDMFYVYMVPTPQTYVISIINLGYAYRGEAL